MENDMTTSTDSDNLLSPSPFLAVVSQLGAIELDPCPPPQGVEGLIWPSREYRQERGEDGRALSWKVKMGALVYVCPPDTDWREWVAKADAEHSARLCEIVLLMAARVASRSFHEARAKAVCFWRGTLPLLVPETQEPVPYAKGAGPSMAVLYWGLREPRFREVFAPYGKVVRWKGDGA